MNRRPLHPALLYPVAIAVGVAIYALSNLIEPPADRLLNFGINYAQMSEDPFGLLGKFPQRIFSPLLANLLGLTGERFAWFAQGCMVGLIATWFAAAHLLGATLLQSLVLSAVLAFTGAVQLFKGHLGYPDPMTFLLLTATIVARRRPWLFWSLLFVNAMHHEQIFFFWPWLLWWRHRLPDARWRADLLGGVLVFGLYVAWRLYVGAHAAKQELTMSHYAALDYFPWGTLGLASLNLLSTFIWFGVLPITIAWHGFVDGWRRAGIGILLLLACQHAVFGVAHDVYRFTCFLFVPLMFAFLRLFRERFGTLIVLALGAVTVLAIELQKPVFVEIGTAVLTKNTANGPIVRPDIVHDILTDVVPTYWATFAAYGAALAATIAIGWRWASLSRRRAALEPST
ncbi:MAG TPA: hypothetical protein ENI87_12000 [bacterium]|nr:hypothetical protein [bacterium]